MGRACHSFPSLVNTHPSVSPGVILVLNILGSRLFSTLSIHIILCHYFIVWFVSCLKLLTHHSSASSPCPSLLLHQASVWLPGNPCSSLCLCTLLLSSRGLPTSALSTPTGASPSLSSSSSPPILLPFHPFPFGPPWIFLLWRTHSSSQSSHDPVLDMCSCCPTQVCPSACAHWTCSCAHVLFPRTSLNAVVTSACSYTLHSLLCVLLSWLWMCCCVFG